MPNSELPLALADPLGALLLFHFLASFFAAPSWTLVHLRSPSRALEHLLLLGTVLGLQCRTSPASLRDDVDSWVSAGLCLNICASMAAHAPGEVVQQLMGLDLFESHYKIPLTVDAETLEGADAIRARMEGELGRHDRAEAAQARPVSYL